MKVAQSLVLLVVLPALSIFSSAQTPAPDTEQKITATLHEMYEAEKRKDLDFILAHLAPDFAEVAGDGRLYHREDVQRGWENVVLHAYSLSDCVFKQMTNDVAYLSCRMSVDGTYKGRSFPPLFRITTIWTQNKDGWVISFEQGTVIPE